MNLTDSILVTTRTALGLNADDTSFDSELKLHINSALLKAFQNGVGKLTIVNDETTLWNDVKDSTQTGNDYFDYLPMFVHLSTKIIFDPPPPSLVEMYNRQIDELLWRLRTAYEGGDTIVL